MDGAPAVPVPAEANDAAAACPDAVRFNTRVGAAAADGAAMLMMDAVDWKRRWCGAGEAKIEIGLWL